jgi:hypothetical protein
MKLFTTACSFLFCIIGLAQTALVQFIHNSPDPVNSLVKVRIQNETILDSLPFQHAGSMIPVDTASLAIIEVFAVVDTSFQFPLLIDTVELQTGSKHIFVLNGAADSLLFHPHLPLRLDHLDQARDVSESGNGLDITFCHYSSEIDSIDIAETALFELTAFEGLAQAVFTDYLSLFTADFAFGVTNHQTQELIGNYLAPFSSLNWSGKAITVITGGFVNQLANNNGIPFGLWATTRDGGPLVYLQPDTLGIYAPLQWVNHATGGAAADIRISLNQVDWTNTIPVHAASGFLDFPAAQSVEVKVHSNLIQGPMDSIWCDTLYLLSGASYRAIFHGSGTTSQPYELFIVPYLFSNTLTADSLSIDFFQGASCFSEMSIQTDTTFQTMLFNEITYGELTPTITIAASEEEWIASSAGDSLTTWITPPTFALSGAERLTLLTHTTEDCAELTAWLLTEDGGPLTPLETLVIPPPIVYAHLQFMHASADTSIASLELYINDSLYIPSFEFRESSGILHVPVNDSLHIALFHANDSSSENPLFEQTMQLAANGNYRLVLAGVTSGQGYNPAPNLRWMVLPAMQEPASDNCALQFIHTATDAGSMRVEESTTPIVPFFSALSFGEVSFTNSLAADTDYALGVYNNDVNFLYGVYALPLNGWSWADSSITILASGFRQPLNNSNGPAFALHAVTAHGNVIPLSDYVSVANQHNNGTFQCYPNPASDYFSVEIRALEADEFNIRLTNAQGKLVHEQNTSIGIASTRIRIETSNLAAGIYRLSCMGKKNLFNREYQKTIVIQHK